MIDFKNTQIAFEAKSNADLRRAKMLFTVIKYPWIVKCSKALSNFATSIRLPISWAVKPTIYRQFVGGETLQECTKVTQELMKYNIRSIFDYSAEGGGTQADIQYTFEETLRSIEYAKGNNSVAYAVFKPTALTTDYILEKASSKKNVTEDEQKQIDAYRDLFQKLCQKAYECDVRLIVDAEDYCFQDEIDQFTDQMMRKYNKNRAIVFTTFQMYRHDRYAYLERLLEDSKQNGYIVGMKFVRGAYMEAERERAKQMGYPDPIYKNKQMTDDNYNNGLRFVVENIDRFELFAGTHNETSNRVLTELIEQHKLQKNDSRIFFAQLYGMSDNLSYNLAHAGYNVTKYIPYAPVKKVLPYLIRRAEENTAMAGQTTRELDMIKTESIRRKAENKKK